MVSNAKLESLIDAACKANGVTLVECDMFRAGKRKTLRLYIDKPEGVTIDDCSNVSRHLSDALDLDPEVIEGAYTLEVSSPGLDRPLKSVADFVRNKGRFFRVPRRTGKPLTAPSCSLPGKWATIRTLWISCPCTRAIPSNSS